MRVKALLAILLIAAVVASTFGIAVGSESGNDLSTGNETGNVTFEPFEFGNTTVLWHQRQVGNAIVEGDYINRQYNTATEELIRETKHWREGLPTELPQNLTIEAEALKIAGGGEYACLYYLSPNSTIYRPAPEAPVWVVWHAHEPDRWGNVTVIDAITGEFIASGVPPILFNEVLPSRPDSTVVLDNGVEAFIFTGPIYTGDPCFDGWYIFVDNVENWLGEMGYEVFRAVDYPNASVLEKYIGNNEIAVFYEHCHGGVDYFWNSCDDMTYDEEVRAWLANYPKIPFVFLANCNGMCEIDPDTLVGAFSKGSLHCGVIVGYCGMSFERCRDCATYRYFWEEMFFSALADGYTVEEAYSLCTDKYPFCEDCILYYGDGDIQLSERIERGLCGCMIGGEVRDVNTNLLSGVKVSVHGSSFYEESIASSDYHIVISWPGEYWLIGTQADYCEINTVGMTMLPPLYVDLSTPEKLSAGYVFDFEGNYGLVPRECNMWYVQKSVNLWLFPPIDHPEWGISEWKAMDSIHSWQFPT